MEEKLSRIEGVTMLTHAKKGRGLFSTKNVAQGDTVFEELPIISCQFAWNQDLGYAACDHCLKPLETVEDNVRRLSQSPDLKLPVIDNWVERAGHRICVCQAKYCSSDCQSLAAEQYHRTLCFLPNTPQTESLQKLRKVWKEIHYPPETTTVFLIMRMYAYIHQSDNKEMAAENFQYFVSDASNPLICEKILGTLQSKILKLRQSFIECVQCLNLDIPPALLSPDGFLTALSILALNSQGIGTSQFAQWVEIAGISGTNKPSVEDFIDSLYARMEETVGLEFLNNEGSGLYLVQSKINHGCDPNMEVIFPNGNHLLAVRALRDIQEGEELTISYLDDCQLGRSRHTRQKLLREKYFFQCICHKCEEGIAEPDETSDDDDDDDDMDDENLL